VSDLLLHIIGGAFLMVSISLSAKFIMEAYLEYIQVKHGIRVVTQKDFEDYMRAMAEEEDDGDGRV